MTSNKSKSNGSGRGNVDSKPTVTPAEVVAVESIAKRWNDGGKTLREVARDAALATWNAQVAGYIGKGRALGTWDDYRQRFESPVSAGPVSKATVIIWGRVGHGIALGVDEKHLSVVAHDGAIGDLGRTLDAAKTKTAYVRAVTAHSKAKAASKAKTASKAKGKRSANPEGQDKGDKPATMPRNNSGRIDMIETALAAMSKPTDAERKRLAEVVDRVGVILGVTFVVEEAATVEAVAS